MQHNWQHKISHHAQLGGIETAVLDNGPGRGNRVAWINTGAGLRFKVVIDRAMDIAEAFHDRHSLAWLSCTGHAPPAPAPAGGLSWLHTFGGGLLTTCGLTHIGGPENDESGERGLHGAISNTAAELVSVIQPNPAAGQPDMQLTGIVRETRALGVNLEMKRTISARLGVPVIRIHDEIVNRGNTPAPHMLMYHMNFGWPLADEGSQLLWEGDWQPRDEASKAIFREGGSFKTCPPAMAEHAGTGEAVAYIDIKAGSDGWCAAGLHNPRLQLAAVVRFKKSQLPWFVNWQHWAPGEYVTGLEPCTNPPVGQAAARKEGTLIMLQPGESRQYELELEVIEGNESIKKIFHDA